MGGESIIAPGNRLLDGREYQWIGPSRDLAEASFAVLELVYLATFNVRERNMIADDAELWRFMRDADPNAWNGILNTHRERGRQRIMAGLAASPPDADAMRRQALSDLTEAANGFASLIDSSGMVSASCACRLAKYVAHRVLSDAEVLTALEGAADVNGSTAKSGRTWARGTIRRGLAYGSNDPLPPVARQFLEGCA